MLSPLRIQHKRFYGWVVVIACLIIGTIIFGTRYSFGVFFKSLESEFSLTRGTTSGVFSVYMLLCCVFGVLGGWALDKYGPRIVTLLMGVFTGLSLLLTSQTDSPWQLFISYGLLLAIGTGATYTVVMSTTSRWFEKKRGLALGIVGSGGGLGIVVMAPLATYLISNLAWRMSFIVMGLIALFLVISLSMLLKKDPHEIGALPDGVKPDAGKIEIEDKQGNTQPTDFSLLQAARTSNFWFLGIIWLLFSLCLHLVLTHIVPHVTDIGISAMEAAVALSLIGSVSIPARLLMGWTSDKIGRKVTAIICSLLQAGAMVWLIWSQELWMLYLFAVVYGFGYGGLDPPVVALIGDTFGVRSIGVIMGALVIGWALGAAIGPIIGGLIFDVRSSYSLAFTAGALAMLVASLLVALIGPGEKHRVRWLNNPS